MDVSFEAAAGWSVVSTSLSLEKGAQAMAFASNQPPDDKDVDSGWPVQTLRSLSASGIVIWAAANTDVDEPELYPSRELPLSLSDGAFFTDGYEMQPAPNVAECGPIMASVSGRFVTVQAWFGVNEPNDKSLADANDELSRLTIS